MSHEHRLTAEQAMTDEQNPLFQVWGVIVPKLEVEKADTIVTMVHDWVRQELTLYAKNAGTDDVTIELQLNHCRAKFVNEDGADQEMVGWRLLLTITGLEPQHPLKEVDCFFPENESGTIIDLVLSRDPSQDQPELQRPH